MKLCVWRAIFVRAIFVRLAHKHRAAASCCSDFDSTVLGFQRLALEGVTLCRNCLLSSLSMFGRLGDLEQGRIVHRNVVEAGLDLDTAVMNATITMYGKCGSLDDAVDVFASMKCSRDIISWNALIAAYSHSCCFAEAIQVFREMQLQGMGATSTTLVTTINACANAKDLALGSRIHSCSVEIGSDRDGAVANSILNMYCKCGEVREARQVFDRMQAPNLASWSTLVAAYAREGHFPEAFNMFQEMLLSGARPSMVTFLGLLSACDGSQQGLKQGNACDELLVEMGFGTSLLIGTTLINMYGRCASPKDAARIFRRMQGRDLVAWNAMISVFAQNGYLQEAMATLRFMIQDGFKPDSSSLPSLLDACGEAEALDEGRAVHNWMLELGIDASPVAGNALLNMYGRCGDLGSMREQFAKLGSSSSSIIAWTALLSSFSQRDNSVEATHTFRRMQLEGVKADTVALSTMLNSCESLQDGELLHRCIAETGAIQNREAENALVNMYGKVGKLSDAVAVFERMGNRRSAASWSLVIGAAARSLESESAVGMFRRMQLEGMAPDKFAIVSALKACARAALLKEGRDIHQMVAAEKRGVFAYDLEVGNAALDMYAKCGSLDEARKVFEAMEQKQDVVSWNSLVSAYARHGQGEEALKLFLKMQQAGARPDEVTFGSVFTASSHSGMVESGCDYFGIMVGEYGLGSGMSQEQVSSMLGVLGRAGRLEEAEVLLNRFLSRRPVEGKLLWMALLGACKIHGDDTRGRRVAKRILEMDPHNTAAYVVLSNIYTGATPSSSRNYEELLDQGSSSASIRTLSNISDLGPRATFRT